MFPLPTAGYLSFLEALSVLLEVGYADRLNAVQKKFRKAIKIGREQRGEDFPYGFVEQALCQCGPENYTSFVEIERAPDFRNLCRVACSEFQDFLRSGELKAEAANLFENGRFYKIDPESFIKISGDYFVDLYLRPRSFFVNYRIIDLEFRTLISAKFQSKGCADGGRLASAVRPQGLRGRKPVKLPEAVSYLRRLDEAKFLGLEQASGEARARLISEALGKSISRGTADRAYRDAQSERFEATEIKDNS